MQFSRPLNVSFRDSSDPPNMTDVSSAYGVRINYLLLIYIPLIFSLFFIFIARISAHRVKINM